MTQRNRPRSGAPGPVDRGTVPSSKDARGRPCRPPWPSWGSRVVRPVHPPWLAFPSLVGERVVSARFPDLLDGPSKDAGQSAEPAPATAGEELSEARDPEIERMDRPLAGLEVVRNDARRRSAAPEADHGQFDRTMRAGVIPAMDLSADLPESGA